VIVRLQLPPKESAGHGSLQPPAPVPPEFDTTSELYAHLNPMPYEAALQMELDLAEDLRRLGYTVTGGH